MRKVICLLCAVLTYGLIGCNSLNIIESENIKLVSVTPITTVQGKEDIGKETVLIELQNLSNIDVEGATINIISENKIVDSIQITETIKGKETYKDQYTLKKNIDYDNCVFKITE